MQVTLLVLLVITLSQSPDVNAASLEFKQLVVTSDSLLKSQHQLQVDSTPARFNRNIRPYRVASWVGLLVALATSIVAPIFACVLILGAIAMDLLASKKQKQLRKLLYTTAPTNKEVWLSIGWSVLIMVATAAIFMLFVVWLSH